MADNENLVTATVAAADAGTDWLQLRQYRNPFDISVKGTFTGNVFLQRKRPEESADDARDIGDAYTASTEEIGEMRGRWDVRLFVKAGGLSSGTVVLELGT